MKTAAVLILAFAFIFTIEIVGQCKRHVEQTAGISFCPPVGWRETSVQGQAEKNFVGRGSSTLTFVAIDQPMTAKQLADDFVKTELPDSPSDPRKKKKLISRRELIVNPKLKVVKLVVNAEMQSIPIFLVHYYLEGPGERRILGLASGQLKFLTEDISLLDAAVKSLVLTR